MFARPRRGRRDPAAARARRDRRHTSPSPWSAAPPPCVGSGARRHRRRDRQRVVAPGAARRARRPPLRHGEGRDRGADATRPSRVAPRRNRRLLRCERGERGRVAVDHGPDGIRCNAVALGSIRTARYDDMLAGHGPRSRPPASRRRWRCCTRWAGQAPRGGGSVVARLLSDERAPHRRRRAGGRRPAAAGAIPRSLTRPGSTAVGGRCGVTGRRSSAEHQHRLRARHERLRPDLLEHLLEVLHVGGHDPQQRVRLPRDRARVDHLGEPGDRRADRLRRRAAPAVQLDVALDRPAQRPGLQPDGEPGDGPARPQPVHAALDRRGVSPTRAPMSAKLRRASSTSSVMISRRSGSRRTRPISPSATVVDAQ